jgi:hypothetical protein
MVAESFGPEMHYDGVVKVLKILQTKDRIGKEISTLVNCSPLQVSAIDIAGFQMVQLLYDISKPLQEFL